MKIVYFKSNNEKSYGILREGNIFPISGDIFSSFDELEESIPVEEVTLLPPVNPKKLICVGLNYKLHAEEQNKELPEEPMIFMCSPQALIGHEETIQLSNEQDRIDYEAELVIVIKSECKNVKKENFQEVVLGYTCGNDVSNRHLQKKDGQFTRAKSFDTYKPIGPCIETDIDPDNIPIKLWQNGELKQSSNTSDMIFSVGEIVEFVSSIMTLQPGDVIYTGTPSGVGAMKKEDLIEIELEGIGVLRNNVK